MLSQTFRAVTLRMALSFVVLGLGVFIGVQLTDLAWAAPQLEQRSSSTFNLSADEMLSPQEAHVCNLAEVVTAPDQIILVCQQAATDNIDLFTILTDDTRHTNRTLATALTAHATAKSVVVTYDPNAGNTPTICDPARCRKLLWLSVK